MCGDTYTSIPDIYSLEEQFSLQRLQTEVDQFFMRATQQIICAHKYVVMWVMVMKVQKILMLLLY
jgi:hypothetical protein